MIQRVFIDTNILIDVLLDRLPFAEQAERIFQLRDDYAFDIYISALSLANIAYVLDRLGKSPNSAVATLMQLTEVADLTGKILNETVHSKFVDFEDGLQYSTAVSIKADVIITRNKKDFKLATIPVLSPDEFLDTYKN